MDVPEEYREELVDKTLRARPKEAEPIEGALRVAPPEVSPSDVRETETAPLRPRSTETTVITPTRAQGEPARYRLIDVDQLIPSHNPHSFAPDPRYPTNVQERDYLRQQEELRKVKTFQGQGRLNPDVVLSNDPTPVNGPPMVTADSDPSAPRIVLGGNGRSMMILRSMQDPEMVARYTQELRERARSFGIDPAEVTEGKILVREMLDVPSDAPKEELAAAVRRYNEVPTLALGPKAQAVSDARAINPMMVREIGDLLAQSGDKSLRKVMTNSPEKMIGILENGYHGAPFITGVNRAELVTADGQLTERAKDKIEGMFLGRLVGSGDLLANMSPSLEGKLQRIAPSVMQVAGANPALDETPVIQAAVRLLNEAEARKSSLEDLVRHDGGLFEKGASEKDPSVILARMIDRTNPVPLQKLFREWASAASGDLRQGDIFRRTSTLAEIRALLHPDLAAAEPLPPPREFSPGERAVIGKNAEDIAAERAGLMAERTSAGPQLDEMGFSTPTPEPSSAAMGVSSGPMSGLGEEPLPAPRPLMSKTAPPGTTWPVQLGPPSGLPPAGGAGPTMQPPLFREGQPSAWGSPPGEGMGVQTGRAPTPEGGPPVPEDVNALNTWLDRRGPIERDSTSDPKTIRALGAMHDAVERQKGRVESLASTLVRAGPRALRVTRGMAAAGIPSVMALSDEDLRKKYDRTVEQIRAVASDPQQITQMLQHATGDIHEHAPNVAIAAGETLTRAATYLQTQIPQGPPPSPWSQKWTPSAPEMRRFFRAYTIVSDPSFALRKAAAGTLMPSDVDALQAVYPALSQNYSLAIAQAVSRHGAPSDPRSRMGTAIMTDVPLPGGTFEAFTANQATHQTAPKPQQPAGRPIAVSRVPGGGKKASTPSSRSALPQNNAVESLSRP
ncbi:MAG: hypothetical protein ACHQ5A_02385 [Opitutales bacterium]